MRLAVGLSVFVFAVVSGCSCTPKKTCRLNSDCSEVERCVESECVVLCRTDRDCGAFEVCDVGECRLAGSGGGLGGGVGGGTGGDGGSDAGADAGSGDAGLPDAGFPDAGQPDAGEVDAGQPDAGEVDAGEPDAGNGMGVYGDLCTRGSDCMSTLCIGNVTTGQGMCTIPCASESMCAPTHACLTISGVSICVPSDSGQPCPSGLGSACFSGVCLVHPQSVSLSVCSTPCESTRSCPAAFSCSLVNVGGTPRKMCTQVGNSCTAQGMNNQCITRWCSTSALTPNVGVCTNSCTVSTDCPTGWACGWDTVNATTVADRCQPIGDPCTVDTGGNNNCVSKTCAQGTPQGDYCTAFCMDVNFNPEPNRCPAGWQCTNAGTTTNPLWVCEQ